MTITDPRKPVFIKKGNRYVAVGSLDDFSRFDAWHSPGLWLHTRGDCCTRMSKIANLEELPSPAIQFAAVLNKHAELVNVLRESNGESQNDLATRILEWIATESAK